jgi:polar amino acid transport system permease protein
VLIPALSVSYPALASQFVLMMLGSSIVSAISATDLTAITNTMLSTTFRSFEFYFVATGLYLVMSLLARLLLILAYRWLFPPALLASSMIPGTVGLTLQPRHGRPALNLRKM